MGYHLSSSKLLRNNGPLTPFSHSVYILPGTCRISGWQQPFHHPQCERSSERGRYPYFTRIWKRS